MKQQAESTEEDLVARMQSPLADDPLAVHEGPVSRPEVADAPGVAESLERGMHSGDAVGVDDDIVRLEGSDGDAL